jgi:hypothetical protein
VAGWIASTELTAWRQRTFISIHYAATRDNSCVITRRSHHYSNQASVKKVISKLRIPVGMRRTFFFFRFNCSEYPISSNIRAAVLSRMEWPRRVNSAAIASVDLVGPPQGA